MNAAANEGFMDYQKLLNQTVQEIKPSGIRKYFDLAHQMKDVISLGVGEPDFATPWEIRQAGIDSLKERKTWYTANRGLEKLCCAISKYYMERFGLCYAPNAEIMVTVGGSEALDLAIRALISPGDEVIIPQPSFVCYEPITRLCGGVPVIIETRAEDGFKLRAKDLAAAITEKTKLLVLPFPANPTGAVMRKEDLEEIAEVLREKEIMILSDEIYCELTYGSPHVSIAQLEGMQEKTILVGGFSKSFAMTGWRLGYALAPEAVLKQMLKIHQFAIMSSPTTSQYAAIKAMSDYEGYIAPMREEYDRRRRLIVEGFNRLGLTCFQPEGAFYIFPSIQKTGLTSEEFCQKLLQEERLALVPGTAFGDCGEGYVRVSYAYSLKHITQALERLEKFMKQFD